MTTVSVARLKARLSEFLAIVRGGDDVVITDRGRPVALLTALDPGEHGGRLAELVRAGIVRPPRRGRAAETRVGAHPAFEDPHGHLLSALLEERQEGR
jgi:prevent-host-death family protein